MVYLLVYKYRPSKCFTAAILFVTYIYSQVAPANITLLKEDRISTLKILFQDIPTIEIFSVFLLLHIFSIANGR